MIGPLLGAIIIFYIVLFPFSRAEEMHLCNVMEFSQILWLFVNYKGQPGALKLPHTQSPGRGPTIIGVLYAVLPCFLHKRLFPGLEPVTFQSHDNNFTSCAKVSIKKNNA
jgi:hypothetical protein